MLVADNAGSSLRARLKAPLIPPYLQRWYKLVGGLWRLQAILSSGPATCGPPVEGGGANWRLSPFVLCWPTAGVRGPSHDKMKGKNEGHHFMARYR